MRIRLSCLSSSKRELFTRENTERVERQKAADMFVVIGNPPYNAGQVNENDNNKNRKYKTMDKLIRDTWAADSKARNKNALYDPYIKAILWALERIGKEGVVAFVTNNGFLDGMAFDGMRKHLAAACNRIYTLDLGGNARKRLKVSDANVFGIRVGVSINLFIKTNQDQSATSRILYYQTNELWNKKQKFDFLNEHQHIGNIAWQTIHPDKQYTWLTEGLHAEFETFIPLGTKKAKMDKSAATNVIFKTYSSGVKTNRDAWVYNFNPNALTKNVQRLIGTYNADVDRWKRREDTREINVDEFVVYDQKKISWSRDLKVKLKRGIIAEYAEHKVRTSLYRPFTKSKLCFDRTINDVVYLFPSILSDIGDRNGKSGDMA